jgi:DNA-binding CsgD family transcriptional regulator
MRASLGLTSLTGRERETTLLDAFVARFVSDPSSLSLVGEAGVGKSILWTHAVEAAREAKIKVLEARPAERERDLAFAGLADLLEGVGDGRVESLPDGQRRALQVAVFRSETLADPIDPHLIGRAVLAVIRGVAAEQPVLLAIDDVQWLDQESGAALAFALRRADEQVGVLSTRRVESGGGEDPDLGLEVERVVVGPLGFGATQRLLRERLGAPLSRSVVQRIHERAGGNPLYAIELARALQERGATLSVGEELPVPRDLGLLLHERLRALPPETAEPLAAVAARGQPPVAEVDTETLEPAFRAGVIVIDRGRVRFTHPLLGAAAYEALPPNRLLALHQHLAHVVDDPEQRARHLALGSAGPNEETAAILDRAAISAADRGAPHAAAELAEHAVRLTAEKPARVERVSAAAAFHIRAGDDVRARELLEEALVEAEPGMPRARILYALAAADNYGDIEKMLECYKAALAEDGIEPQLHAEILGEYGAATVLTRADRDQSGSILQHAAAEAEALGDTALLARTLSALALSNVYAGEGFDQELVERLLALQPHCEQMPIDGQPATRFGWILQWGGEVEKSRQLLARAVEIAERNGDSGVTEPRYFQSFLALYLGTWRDGVEIASRALEEAVETGREDMEVGALAVRCCLLAHLGDEEGARADAEAARKLDDFTGGMHVIQIGGLALASLELSLDRPQEALLLGRPATDLLAALGCFEPGAHGGFPVHAEAAIAVGELEEAAQLLDSIEERAFRLDREWALACAARCRGLLAAARNDEKEAIACFERSLAEQQRVEYRQFDHARTLLAYGETLRRFKHRARAREAMEHAIAIFDELGARLWSEKARRELARVSGRRTATGLTETEQRVADLVVAGRSNKEIAGELFVAVRTVESNLTRIYAKLGVRSRTELIARLRTN